jgi:hypothetical protein
MALAIQAHIAAISAAMTSSSSTPTSIAQQQYLVAKLQQLHWFTHSASDIATRLLHDAMGTHQSAPLTRGRFFAWTTVAKAVDILDARTRDFSEPLKHSLDLALLAQYAPSLQQQDTTASTTGTTSCTTSFGGGCAGGALTFIGLARYFGVESHVAASKFDQIRRHLFNNSAARQCNLSNDGGGDGVTEAERQAIEDAFLSLIRRDYAILPVAAGMYQRERASERE